MNNNRRKILKALHERLSVIKDEIEAVCEEETDSFDNLPEGIQDSEKGETMQDMIGEMENAQSLTEDAMTALEETFN